MSKLFSFLSIVTLTLTFTVSSAHAEQPCNGSNDNCSWTCTQDDQGNILNYTVTCTSAQVPGERVYCVEPGEGGNSVSVGSCMVVPGGGDPDPFDTVLELEEQLVIVTEEVGGSCEAPKGQTAEEPLVEAPLEPM
ncbi:MAG: hypothetical protein AAGF11_12380 [Myxococcota bacterium]